MLAVVAGGVIWYSSDEPDGVVAALLAATAWIVVAGLFYLLRSPSSSFLQWTTTWLRLSVNSVYSGVS